MEVKSCLARMESLIRQNQIADPERVQAIAFLAQVLGESYGYFFEVHHYRVFSRALQADIEGRSDGNYSDFDRVASFEIFKSVAKIVQSVPIEQLEFIAAYFYFEQKGYSCADIESALNTREDDVKDTQKLIAELKGLATRTMATSNAR